MSSYTTRANLTDEQMPVSALACPAFNVPSRWTDDVLEGFLYSTLVDGSGLVLDKLDSDGSGKKSGVSDWTKTLIRGLS